MIYVPWHFPLQDDETIQGASEKAESLFKENYPAIYNHLLNYKEKLSKRNKAETGIRYEWYALQRWGAKYKDDFSKQKIIYPETTQGAYFVYDNGEYYLDKTCFFMLTDYPEYLVATLSSKLFEYAYKKIFSSIELGTSAYQYNKHAFINLPILKPENCEDKYISILTELSKSAINNSDNISIISDIDDIIFEIYGISEEEKEQIRRI